MLKETVTIWRDAWNFRLSLTRPDAWIARLLFLCARFLSDHGIYGLDCRLNCADNVSM